MTIAKHQLIEMLDKLPDEVDVEELMYRLYLLEKLDGAEEDVRGGHWVSHDEAAKEAAQWRK